MPSPTNRREGILARLEDMLSGTGRLFAVFHPS